MCEGRIAVIQNLDEDPLSLCPYCGMEVVRVISKTSFSMRGAPDADKAASKGFTTFRRSGRGTWEKLAGEGPDQLQSDPPEPPPAKRIDLDET